MSRQLRNQLTYDPVQSYPVAEHRYIWNPPLQDPMPYTYKEVREAAPYKVGEVVYLVHGDGFRKAIIACVDCVKDAYDDWRECYTVFPETKKGQWSKLYYTAHPGFIQRAYLRAGLAPDIPTSD